MKRARTPKVSTRLAEDIAIAKAAVAVDHPGQLMAADQCELIQHQVNELLELATAEEDIDRPDKQARDRFVKIAALAMHFAEQLDQHLAANPRTMAEAEA